MKILKLYITNFCQTNNKFSFIFPSELSFKFYPKNNPDPIKITLKNDSEKLYELYYNKWFINTELQLVLYDGFSFKYKWIFDEYYLGNIVADLVMEIGNNHYEFNCDCIIGRKAYSCYPSDDLDEILKHVLQ